MKAYYSEELPKVSSSIIVPILYSLIPSAVMAYVYALWFDIEHDMWGHFIADLIFPPLGIIHGVSLLFTNWPY